MKRIVIPLRDFPRFAILGLVWAVMFSAHDAVADADIAVMQTDSPDPVVRGENVTYTIILSNSGPDAAQVSALLTLPMNTENPVITASQGTCDAQAGVCNLGIVPFGGTVLITVTVTTTATTPSTIQHLIETSPADFDPDPSNNSSVETTAVIGGQTGPTMADLATIKGAFPFLGAADTVFDFTVDVTNLGPETATNVVVDDTLPPGAVIVSTLSGCVVRTDGFTCNLGDIAAAQSATISYSAYLPGAGLRANAARAATDSIDTNPMNDQHQAINGSQPIASATGQGADLEAAKFAAPEKSVLGHPPALAVPEVIDYTVTVRNNGPEAATGVRLLDIATGSLAVPMNVVALSVSQGSCLLEDSRRPGQLLTIPVYGVDEAQLRCSLGALAAGATATVTISVETGGEVGRLALNAAQVLSDTPDPDLTNNVTLLLVPEPQILGDVNDDGLVDFDDRDAVFNCADDSSGDECDDADVNGDGTVDPKDAAIVTQRRTASVSVNAATATFVKGDTETLNALEEYYEYYKLYLRSSSELPFNKFLALSIFGPLESVQMYNGNPPAQNGVSGGDYKIYTDIPDGELVGVSGCETCIGMIVLRPDVDPLVVHFNGRDDVDDTLDDLGPFPAGTRVAICGGNNSEGSNITLIQVTRFLLDNPQIEVEGYSNTIGLWIDNTGTFFLTNRDAPSNNVP